MTLLVTNWEMEHLGLAMDAFIDPIETAFRELGAGGAASPLRARMFLPGEDPGTTYWFNNIMGASSATGYAALRFDSAVSRMIDREGQRRKERVGDFVGLVLLFDLATAELEAVLHDHYLSTRRVAATSAVGIRHLARPDSRELGLIGSGEQAHAHALAACTVRPIERIRIYSPSAANREALARRLEGAVPASVVACAGAREVVESADIVIAATSSRTPVFDGAWLRDGTHVVSIVGGDRRWPAREIDHVTVRRADVVVCNLAAQAVADGQPKLLDLVAAGELDLDDVLDLADVVAGERPDRAPDAITLHDNNAGMGIQFAAVGSVVLASARAAGVGRELDPDWFTTRGGTYAP